MKKKLLAIILANFFCATFLSAQYTGGIGDGSAMATAVKVLPTPAITSNSPVCDGATIELYAPFFAGATYHWTGPNGYDASALEMATATISGATVSEAGTYNLTITLAGGISNNPAAQTDVVVSDIPGAPTTIIGADLICGIDDTIQPYSTPTNADYETYLWEVIPSAAIDSIGSDGTNAKTIYWDSDYSGAAEVRVAGENFCGTSDYFVLDVNVAPVLGVSNLLQSDEICLGVETTTVTVDSIENALAYNWSLNPPSSGTIIMGASDTIMDIEWDPAFTGDVDVILEYNNTCFTEDDTLLITINDLPLTDVIDDIDICDGDDINIGGTANPDYTYSWTSDPAGFTSSDANPLVSPTETTEYYLELSDNNTLCMNFDTVIVTVNLYPLKPDLPLEEDEICLGQETSDYSISPVTGADSYNWSLEPLSAGTLTPSDTEVTITWDAAFTGVAKLFVDAENSCGTSDKDSTVITVNSLPLTDVIDDIDICDGDEINIGGTVNPDYTYSWTSEPVGFTSSDADPLVSPTETTEYYLKLTDDNTSCINYDTVVVTVLPGTAMPETPDGAITVIVDGINPATEAYSTSSTNAIGYIWSLDPETAGTISGGNSDNISVEFVGGFTGDVDLNVQAYNNCDTTEVVTLQVSVTLDIEELENTVVKVFPNPASDNLYIESIGAFSEYELVIYNSFGQVVLTKNVVNSKEAIEVSSFAKGLYTLEFRFDKQVYKHKIFIQ